MLFLLLRQCHSAVTYRKISIGQKHLLEVPETCKDMSPSGLEILESTPSPEGGPAPGPHTNPCRRSARKWNVITAEKASC